jgi:phospholipid transport system substrate-binding protein
VISRRVLLATSLAVAALPRQALTAGDATSPAAAIAAFYDSLVAAMKDGPTLGFTGRRDRLGPAIRRTFDLPLMTRLMVGPQWLGFTPAQQQQLVAAFTDFSIATYASRFEDYSGEIFQVDPGATPLQSGVVVHTKLIKSDGERVALNYLMHDNAGAWQIVDVYLSGTVSELATRRSEFASVMRRGGPDALVDVLQKKVAELRG